MKKNNIFKVVAVSLAMIVTPLSSLYAYPTANSLYQDAYALQLREDYYGAIENYLEVLNLNPQYGEAWYNLSLCTYHLGEYELAVEYADNASKYIKNNTDLDNLKGLANLALGNLDEARNIFNDILKRYPNNVDARFGLAELDIFNGSLSSAENRYLDALKRDEKNRKALLSLALVCQELGKDDVAEKYINQALQYHSGESDVHYMASYLAAKRGDLKTAEFRARNAVQIKNDNEKAYELLSDILYAQKRYEEVIDICDYLLGRNRSLSSVWYLKGLAQYKLNRNDDALVSFTIGLNVNPQDEVMRYALEQVIDENLPVEDSRRSNWAQYHINKAKEYNRNYEGPSERFEYQRALSVDPLNMGCRQSFASLLERDGFYELYLYQLEFIKNNTIQQSTSESVQKNESAPKAVRSAQQIKNDDIIESLHSLLANNLSNKWDVNSFYLDKTRWNIGLYYIENPVQFMHVDVEDVMAKAAKDIFDGVSSTAVEVHSGSVSGFGEAYRISRTAGMDYFLIMSIEETERSFCISSDVYSAKTGTKLSTIKVYRTGNNRVSKALMRFRQSILDMLPIRGTVLENAQGTILVDLGKSDNITAGSEFDIVKKGMVSTSDKGPGVTYKSKDVIGTLVVDVVNEEISEGTFNKKGFYDVLNVGDEVILTKLGGENSDEDGTSPTDTSPAAYGNGNPATNVAFKAENNSFAEDLKVQNQETSLLSLIRSIF